MSLRTFFGCAFGVHRFDKWVDANHYKTRWKNSTFGAGVIEGIPYWIEGNETLTQTRTCQDCGVKRSREIAV